MTPNATPTGIREKLRDHRGLGAAAAGALLVISALVLARTFWPTAQADLDQSYYSDDDGTTWFADSTFRVAPFDRAGKTAVVARVYTYAGGGKSFCGYLAKFTSEAKAKLEAAIAEAGRAGKPPGSVWMWSDRGFMTANVLVKKPGDAAWLAYNDPRAAAVFAVVSPDGSEVDEQFVK